MTGAASTPAVRLHGHDEPRRAERDDGGRRPAVRRRAAPVATARRHVPRVLRDVSRGRRPDV